MTGNLQADGVQSRQTLFVRYCLRSGSGNRVWEITGCLRGLLVQPEKITRENPSASFAGFPALIRRFSCRRKCRSGCRRGQAFRSWGRCVPVQSWDSRRSDRIFCRLLRQFHIFYKSCFFSLYHSWYYTWVNTAQRLCDRCVVKFFVR